MTPSPRFTAISDSSRMTSPGKHWWVRFYAATALAEIGPAGEEALVGALHDPEPSVHEMARYLLERGEAIPALP